MTAKFPGISTVIHGNGAVAEVMGHVCGGVIGYQASFTGLVDLYVIGGLHLTGGIRYKTSEVEAVGMGAFRLSAATATEGDNSRPATGSATALFIPSSCSTTSANPLIDASVPDR